VSIPSPPREIQTHYSLLLRGLERLTAVNGQIPYILNNFWYNILCRIYISRKAACCAGETLADSKVLLGIGSSFVCKLDVGASPYDRYACLQFFFVSVV
jgi:hypothetical protein